jgi:conjugative relaxase-like TrwC/TraI family protein
MLFITPSTSATEAKDYYTRQLAPSDYYTNDMAEMPGQWHGLGSELLGLKGDVQQKDFFALADNLNPQTGKNLTRNTQAERRVLYDFTFDAPKSVSLAYELGGDEHVLEAFQSSVKETMNEMEGAMMTRVRAKGADEDRVTSNMVWAGFTHRTTRPVRDADGVLTPDPQLHLHATVFNATYDEMENKWKAAQFLNLVRDKGYYQAAFHSRLAGKLADLGYGIERDGNSFRLAGIDKSTADKFSRRSDQIEAEAERLGITNAKTKGELGRRTREKKDAIPKSMEELRALWKARLADGEQDAITGARRGQETTSPGAMQGMDYALSHCFERQSAVPEKELLKIALIHSVGTASVNEVQDELSRPNILRREKAGAIYATTKDVLREEIAMSDFVREGRGQHVKLGGIKPPALDPKLGKEHCEAGGVILNSRDTVTALKGGAGTGKTTLVKAVRDAIKSTGKEVFAFAPSAEASRGVQRSEGFENADTVERLLIDPKMQARVKGQVLWVDEAGLLSVKDMKRLFDVAQQQQARIILTGDSNQHNAVFRGDALRILERDSGMKTATLKEIRRQTNADYRSAVKAISEGEMPGRDGRTRLEEGITMLDNAGAIIETSGEDRYRRIAGDYAEVTAARKHGGGMKSALVVSPTHREADKVTEAIREELKADGRLGKDERQFTSLRPLNLTEAQRTDRAEYSAGAVVQFVQNARGFRRGERVTVAGTDKEGVNVTRADGSATILPLDQAGKFQLYREERVALARGDRLRITMNGFTRETRRGLLGTKGKDRLDNGAVYQVEGFTKQGDIELSNGFVLPKDYGGMAHGYVVTSHASQGKTVDVSLIALGRESFAAANREQLYVSVSRGREAVRLYTDNKAAMMDAVQSSNARLSATELIRADPPKPKPSYMQRLIRSGVIQRAYSAVRERMAAYQQTPHTIGREGPTLG